MGNPLLLLWAHPARRPVLPLRQPRLDLIPTEAASSDAIFLVLRRMRAPLIVLIVIFLISILGLAAIPGQDESGRPVRMTMFDAFYFMSYTATTIGYGEIPHSFSYGQRMWVTLCIYLTVIGWAYAIGTLLSLGQDRSFRAALAVQGFRRRVRHLREPFLVIAGYGQAGRSLGRSLDTLGRRFVVLDTQEERIATLDVDSYNSDVPGLAADARSPASLGLAGLALPRCEGVLALTDDDEANLAIVITARLLRPDLPVIARAGTRELANRMNDFGPEAVIDPDGRFGEYLALSLLQPASYQLMTWLMAPPGTERPARPPARGAGRWVVYAEGYFAQEMSEDLRAAGLDVTIVHPQEGLDAHAVRSGARSDDPHLRALTDVSDAVGLVAGADNDTTNLSLIAAARASNPSLFIAARQNARSSAPLLAALGVDSLMVPTRLIAEESLARLVSPLLWTFLQEIPLQDNQWAEGLLRQLEERCGNQVPEIWRLGINAKDAPAIAARLAAGDPVVVGDLLRQLGDRDATSPCVPLLLATPAPEGSDPALQVAPAPDAPLTLGDTLLFAGRDRARSNIDRAAADPVGLAYLCTGTQIPDSWVGRRLTGARLH